MCACYTGLDFGFVLRSYVMAGKHRRASSLGTTRMTAGVLTALTMASTCISTANAVPKVVSQPGTQDAQEQPPIQQAPSQTVQSTPIHRVEAVRYIPGAPQAVQPVVVKNVITKKVVYETSPGMVMLSPAGSGVLNPVNVAKTFSRNIRQEDRGVMEAAGGAAAGGALGGAMIGAAAGAAGLGAAGAAVGVGTGAMICGAITATIPVNPAAAVPAALCWPAASQVVGPVAGGAVGVTAGAMLGAPAGLLFGAQAGASMVPGGRAAFDRTVADTTWDLESQARVSQGAEPLAGDKPGDSMPSGPQAATKPDTPKMPVIADQTSVESVLVSSATQLPSINAANLQLPDLSMGSLPAA